MFGKFNVKAAAVVQKNKDSIYVRGIQDKSEPKTIQQWYNSASPIWNESKEVQVNFMKRMQMSFSPSELQQFYTVNTKELGENKPITTKCIPTAFGSACSAVSAMHRLFELRYISSNDWGGVSDFTCDFVEDENGLCYFLKIYQYEKFPKNKEIQDWKASTMYPKAPLMSWEIESDHEYKEGCSLGLMCHQNENS